LQELNRALSSACRLGSIGHRDSKFPKGVLVKDHSFLVGISNVENFSSGSETLAKLSECANAVRMIAPQPVLRFPEFVPCGRSSDTTENHLAARKRDRRRKKSTNNVGLHLLL